MPSGWNDVVSSLRVYKNTAGGKAKGYWTSITGGSDLTFTTHIGFHSSHTESTETVNQYNLSYEMKVGIEFASETISESYSYQITQDVEDTYSVDYDVTVTFTCERDPNDPDGGVGLWQWVVESDDGTNKTWTQHYSCRTGSGYFNVAPACPWNACVEQDCKQCRAF